MSSVDTRHFEWLNRNAYRAFPFEEDAGLSASDGVRLPSWCLLDARFVVIPFSRSATVESRPVRLAGFSVSGESEGSADVSLDFLVSAGSERIRVVAGFSVRPGSVTLARAEARSDGAMVSASLFAGAPSSWDDPSFSGAVGSHETPGAPAIVPSRCVVVPGGIGVDALYGNLGAAAVGRVHLRNGYNTSMRISGGAIELDISPDAGIGFECPEDRECDAIYFINGQRADTDGGFSILAGDGVRTSTGTYNGIPAVFVSTTSLVDSYAKPR